MGILVETISSCFVGEYTDDRIQMQVIKALSAAINVDDINSALHGGLLLKAVRIIYNIFLISKSPTIQTVAQATLVGISSTVFRRTPERYDFEEMMKNHKDKISNTNVKIDKSRILKDVQTNDDDVFDEPHTLSYNDLGEADPTTRNSQDILKDAGESQLQDTFYDTVSKDAYLIFRAFCKLSMKPISGPESATDLKSQAMRSKLVSLALIHHILKNHSNIFVFPSPCLFTASVQATKASDLAFIIAVRQYICLVFTRNIVSIVPQVFDLSMDIFGRILYDLRTLLKVIEF
jgi:brefeldin A-inhibited guanine nucleotide-exchange protein